MLFPFLTLVVSAGLECDPETLFSHLYLCREGGGFNECECGVTQALISFQEAPVRLRRVIHSSVLGLLYEPEQSKSANKPYGETVRDRITCDHFAITRYSAAEKIRLHSATSENPSCSAVETTMHVCGDGNLSLNSHMILDLLMTWKDYQVSPWHV